MGRFVDRTGERYGRLTVLRFAELRSSKAFWLCQCDCGKPHIAAGNTLQKGDTRSCGCWLKEVQFPNEHMNRGGRENQRIAPEIVAFRHVYRQYKKNADGRGLVFDLNELQFSALINGDCYYCGVLPSERKVKGNKSIVRNGIDRVDSSKGYVMENVRSCCSECNYLKMARTEVEFFDLIRHAILIGEHLGISQV